MVVASINDYIITFWITPDFRTNYPPGTLYLYYLLKTMKVILSGLKKIGEFISFLFLLLFYFIFFGIFALFIRSFTDFLKTKPKSSNFIRRKRVYEKIEDFFSEG